MNYFIQIERVPYEEPYHLEMHWTISSGETSSCFELYDNATVLTDFAKALKDFPKHSEDKFIYQTGSEKLVDKYAHFFRLIFATNPRGHNASIDIRYLNHRERENTRIVDYRLNTNTPRLRYLAKLFSEFSKLQTTILYWDDVDGFVGSVDEFRSGKWRAAHA